MIRCKLCHIIHDMLFEGCIILDQLALFVKLQPVLDGASIKCYCLISKCVGDACPRKVIICIHRCLQICTVAGHICFHISIRVTAKIYFPVIAADSITDHLIGFFYLQFTSHCLRHDRKLGIIKAYVRILRCYLILFLGTVQCFHF